MTVPYRRSRLLFGGLVALLAMGGLSMAPAHAQNNGFLYTAHVVRESWAANNRDVIVRYLRAQQRTLDALHDPVRTKEARDAVRAGYFPKIDQALWEYVWENNIAAFPRTGEMTAQQMEQAAKLVNEFQSDPVTQAVIDASWTNSYAAEAVKQLAAGGK